MKAQKRLNWKSGIAVLAIIEPCIATALAAQSINSNSEKSLGWGKLGLGLQALEGTNPNAGTVALMLQANVIDTHYFPTVE